MTLAARANPQVSVIIPAFNAAAQISTAVGSALAQTKADIEVLVVDDGSTDATPQVVEAIHDTRLRLIRQANRGQSAAINAGAAQARGEFIKLLDADDWMNPQHLEAQLRALAGQDDCVACCRWGYFLHDSFHPTVREEHADRDYADPLEWLVDSLTLDEGMMGGWRWLIPRTLWKRAGGFDERLNLNNDFHFSVNLLLASSGVRFAPGAVYAYRKGVNHALSASGGRAAMESALLTTELGTQLLLQRENSPRIRKVCADRFQQWLFRFYPEFPDLAEQAERKVRELGGSDLALNGGTVLKVLQPIIGWRAVRRLQCVAYGMGWRRVLNVKTRGRLSRLS